MIDMPADLMLHGSEQPSAQVTSRPSLATRSPPGIAPLDPSAGRLNRDLRECKRLNVPSSP